VSNFDKFMSLLDETPFTESLPGFGKRYLVEEKDWKKVIQALKQAKSVIERCKIQGELPHGEASRLWLEKWEKEFSE